MYHHNDPANNFAIASDNNWMCLKNDGWIRSHSLTQNLHHFCGRENEKDRNYFIFYAFFHWECSSRRLNQMLSNEFIMQTGARARVQPNEKNVPSSLFMFVVWCGALHKRGLKIDASKSTTTSWLAGCVAFSLYISLILLFFYILYFLFRMWMVACMRIIRLRVRSIYGKGSYQIHRRQRFDKMKTSMGE